MIEYGVFWKTSSVVIVGGGVSLYPLPSPGFVYWGLGARVWFQVGEIRGHMTLEVFEFEVVVVVKVNSLVMG